MNDKIRMKKAPKGAPFWERYINFGKGKCEVGCLFCYNNRWPWAKEEWDLNLIDDGLELQFKNYKWEPAKCKQYEGPYNIMMCSVGDPFADQNKNTALEILDLARRYPEVGNHLRVLSKRNGYCQVDGYHDKRPSKKTMFGATVVTLDERLMLDIMPLSSSLLDIFGAYLYRASANGHPIFISCEPMLIGMDLLKLVELLNEHEVEELEEIWVGKLNYGFGCEDFAMSDEEIIGQVKILTDSYNYKVYLKRGVRGSEELREAGIVAKEGTIYDEKTKI